MAWYSKLRSLFGQPPVHEAGWPWPRSLAGCPATRRGRRDAGDQHRTAHQEPRPCAPQCLGAGRDRSFRVQRRRHRHQAAEFGSRRAFQNRRPGRCGDWTEKPTPQVRPTSMASQALACRAMLEGGECLIRLRPPPGGRAGRSSAAQLLEPEHLPISLNLDLPSGNVVRSASNSTVRAARRLPPVPLAPRRRAAGPMSGQGGMDTVRIDAKEIIHLFRVLRPGQIRGEPWLSRPWSSSTNSTSTTTPNWCARRPPRCSRVRHQQNPEDNLMGEGAADGDGIALAGLEPGTLQILEPGEGHQVLRPSRRRWLVWRVPAHAVPRGRRCHRRHLRAS